MLTNKSIFAACTALALILIAAMYLLVGVPGLLLGAIIGVFAAMMLHEKLVAMLPENRRRVRRMMRHEGLC
jgi:uncharacterized protein YneF (UPF0154 family)